MRRFHIIPEANPLWLTKWYDLLLAALRRHPWHTDRAEEAEILIPGVDTAVESNWPEYGKASSAFLCGSFNLYREHLIERLLALPLQSLPGQLLLFDMNPFSGLPELLAGNGRVDLAANSLHRRQYRPGRDVSFPTCSIVQFQREHVASNENTLLVSLVGWNSHPVREALARLHNGRDVVIRCGRDRRHFGRASTGSSLEQPEVRDFAQLLLNSRFGFVPRGDALFSYRLFETMAAGAVPVILSDGWVLPFSEFLDWPQFSVVIPESQAADSLDILRNLPDARVLEMRRLALRTYQEWFANLDRQVAGLLRCLNERKFLAHCQRWVAGLAAA
jgi:hypothetical protein